MANEILIHGYATGLTTVKAVLRNATHQIWNTAGTPAFETYNAANIADYDIATTEQGAAGCYVATMPTSTAGWYRVSGYIIAGASLAEADMLNPIADYIVFWNGTAFYAPATQASVDTIDDFLDTEVAAIKAKTDNLPADPADASDIAASFALVATQASVNTIDDFLDTEIAAIKAKTDQLTFTTANRVDSQVFGMEAGTVTAAAVATGAIDADAIADNAIDAGAIAADAITAAKIADGAIDAATLAAGTITAAKFAAGAIDAAAIAADAIGASELAADAVAEIADAVWDEDATGHQTGGTFGQAIGDPGANTNTIFAATVNDALGASVGADTAELLTRMGSPSNLGTGGTLAANLVDIEGQTDDIGVAGAGLTALATQASVDAVDNFIDTEVAAIKAVTDLLPNGGALTTIQADLDNLQTRVPAALVDGRMDSSVGAVAANAIADAGLAADLDVYHAIINVVDDDSAAADRWQVVWYKNGVPVATADATSPTLQLQTRAGVDVFAATAMTAIGGDSDGFQLQRTTTTRMTDGAGETVIARATIDGAVRKRERQAPNKGTDA